MSNRNATVTVNTKANTGGLKQVSSALTSFDSGLKGAIGNLTQFKGALGALAVVGIAKGIKSFADDMYDAFKVQWLAEKNVNDALYSNMTARGESQKAIDDEVKAYKELASAQQKLGVIGDEVTLSGMAVMTQMGLTAKQVKDMTPLIQDLAVKQYGLNVSGEQYKQVSQSIASMVNMGKLNLQGYGVQVTDVERKQFKAMSQSERYTFVMNKLKNSVAGANEAMAQTSGGKMQQMNNAIGDCEEKVGQLVNTIYGGFASMALPIVEEATDAFQEFMTIVNGDSIPEDGFKYFTDDDVAVLQDIGTGLNDIIKNLGIIFDMDSFSLAELIGTQQFLTDMRDIVTEISNVIQKLAELRQAYNVATDVDMKLSLGGVKSITGNATGTNYFEGGLTHINENGGEIVNLPNGTQIIPHDVSQKMVGSSSNVTVNVTVVGNMIGNAEFADEMGDIITGRLQMALANMS